jgi:hypothetical protein
LGLKDLSEYFYNSETDAKTKNLSKSNSAIDHGTVLHFTNRHEKKVEQSGRIRKIIECAIERYVCCFCKYKGTRQDLENHYYDIHEEVIIGFPGIHLSRKIDLLIINGDKYFVKSFLRL